MSGGTEKLRGLARIPSWPQPDAKWTRRGAFLTVNFLVAASADAETAVRVFDWTVRERPSSFRHYVSEYVDHLLKAAQNAKAIAEYRSALRELVAASPMTPF
jgi:hypothetical protein